MIQLAIRRSRAMRGRLMRVMEASGRSLGGFGVALTGSGQKREGSLAWPPRAINRGPVCPAVGAPRILARRRPRASPLLQRIFDGETDPHSCRVVPAGLALLRLGICGGQVRGVSLWPAPAPGGRSDGLLC